MTANDLTELQTAILKLVHDEGERIATESIYDLVEEARPTTDEDGEPIDDQDPYETSREELGALEDGGLLDHDEKGMASMGYSSLTEKGKARLERARKATS